jgi:hypothetical protein
MNNVAVTTVKSEDPGTTATATVTGGFTAATTYTVTVGTGVSDVYGGAMPMAHVFSFTTVP